MAKKIIKRVTEYFEDPLDGESVVEYFTDPKQDEPKQVTDTFSKDEKSEIRADEDTTIANSGQRSTYSDYSKTKGKSDENIVLDEAPLKQIQWTTESCDCKIKATEVRKFEVFVAQQIKVLQKRATESQSVNLLLGKPNIDGQKIEGTLAYAGVSLNNRIYLPEELAKGDGMRVPLIINHASIEGAEQELYQEQRVPPEIVKALERGEEIGVGYINLRWDGDQNVLFYEGVIEDPFWIKEAEKGDMAVSLGMYYDADSPQYCPKGTCYTIIKNGEFHEVSLVWHPGFAISTMEAVEVALKKKAMEALQNIQNDELDTVDFTQNKDDIMKLWEFWQVDMETHEKVDDTTMTVKAEHYGQAIDDYIANWNTEHPDKTTGYPMAQGKLQSESSEEAVGPHSREYDYIINEPTTTPEITGSNATQYAKPPSTRIANARMNQNMVPSDLSPDDKKYLKHTEFD